MVRMVMACSCVLAGMALGGCGGPASTEIVFPYEWLGNIEKSGFDEPSGIVYHPSRGTLFLVGDDGDICEMTTKGAIVKKKLSGRADYEGVTCDPATGLLYVAVEGQETILEIDPETFETTRRFPIERTFGGKLLMKKGGQGIEAITFVPSATHAQGGRFYVANQSFTLDNPTDISAVFEVELPLRSGAGGDGAGRIVRYFQLGVTDLSGLHYDKAADRLYVISDGTNTFWEVTLDGKIVRGLAFPGENQEGLTVDPEGYVYIAQDSGGVLKIRWLRD